LAQLDTVRDVLQRNGRTLAQGALAWIWAHDERAIPLPGFRNRQQVEENTAALALGPLSAEEHAEVESALSRY
jgi:aryl-alcohol dehydrogenase-like predicted oxidoreductase